ncbi:hypothetical protein DDZ18_10080 [Marinicauda salina]|uniref:EF-hand domain-containing protein n=1 Tax=Marinicauda salina TaxID=2135793 RepID=A0A2U2BSR4_9PROT|nr:hypothetical protein [Marinicauda salina]PWE17042.1 hypothetical protein DDZ18_10080 [Marinicauda salina]
MKTILALTAATVALATAAPGVSAAAASEPGAKQMPHGGMMTGGRHHGGRHGGSGMHGMHGLMMLQAADADDDNTVTRAELADLHTQEFDYRDRNGDGYLTIEDASPMMRRMHAIASEGDGVFAGRGMMGGHMRGGHMMTGADDDDDGGPGWHMFGMDDDEDGRLSRDEFLARHMGMFDELDADGDDAVTPAELDAAVEAHQERRGSRLFWWRD